MTVQPFRINIAQSALDDLRERLARTRWPDQVEGAGWDYGTNMDYLKQLVDYWQSEFDWRTQEAKLNQLAQFRAEIDGLGIHFIHERGKGPNPLPLILTHGWPGSFFELAKLIPLLTDPAAHGGDPADSFDVIIPSLPGYGFSDRPRARGGMTTAHAAEIWARLMTEVLGYPRFAAHGGDFGAIVTQRLAAVHPELLLGIHLTYIGHYNTWGLDQSTLSEAEQAYVGRLQEWVMSEGGYIMIQGTKPQTLAYGLNDSPAGLAGWITEKFRAWMDCDGEIERRISKDELLTNIMLYWATETIAASMRIYFEDPWQELEKLPDVPAAFAVFPKDISQPPREWVERRLHLAHWTEMPRGGHFAAIEEPELLAEDLRAFLRPLRG